MSSAPEWISVPRMTMPTVWMATRDGLVLLDLIAVELAMNGRRNGWKLTRDEKWFAARIMLDQKVAYSIISTRVGVSARTLEGWFPGEIEPAAEYMARGGPRGLPAPTPDVRCGTRRGYRRHRKRGERQCQRCKEANSLADRHYRLHGTYIGAPDLSAVAS